MSDFIESQGKNVEEAVSEALLRLGARREEVEIEVVQEGKSGFLGVFGGKPALVRVSRKGGGGGRRGGGGPSRRAAEGPRRGGKPPREESRRGTTRNQGQPAARMDSRPDGLPRGRLRTASVDSPPRQDGPGIKAVQKAKPLRGVRQQDVPNALAEIAGNVLRLSGFQGRCEVIEGEYHLVRIVTDDNSAGVLIGRHGTTVDALEHLVERMASQAVGDRVNMNLDVNNYRRRREENLLSRTQEIVEKVSQTGREIHLEPLCSRERRLVHLEVARHEGLRTYTIAGASGKHVVVARDEQGQEAQAGPPVDSSREGDVSPPAETTPDLASGQSSVDNWNAQ